MNLTKVMISHTKYLQYRKSIPGSECRNRLETIRSDIRMQPRIKHTEHKHYTGHIIIAIVVILFSKFNWTS